MKKYKILITLASMAILIMIAVSTIAAFTFSKSIRDAQTEVGVIDISSKSFLSYANDVSKDGKTTQQYLTDLKSRSETPIEIPSADTITTEIADDGLNFVLKNEYNIIIARVSTTISEGSIQTASATSGDRQNIYFVSISENSLTIKVSEHLTTIAVATCTISDDKITNISTISKVNKITCYATEKTEQLGYSDEDKFYLNQLGVKFTFDTQIPVYFRIHFEDAWLSTKYYTSGTNKTSYITKGIQYKLTEDTNFIEGKQYYIKTDQVYKRATVNVGDSVDLNTYYEESSESAFSPSDTTNWIYDSKTNCAYFKTICMPTTTQSIEAEFAINNEYWYSVSDSTAYREAIKVEVSFYVDIVQANRAEKIWGVDFEALGIE